MNKSIAAAVYICSGLITALSQLLLKMAADKDKRGLAGKILDCRVIAAYAMMLATVFLNMYAMRYLPYKYTQILSTVSYIFVLLLSRICLHEKISRKQAAGAVFIFAGILLFGMY